MKRGRPLGSLGLPIAERFAAKMMPCPACGCHLWEGAINGTPPHQYGTISYEGRLQPAHVVAWVIKNGPVPPGVKILHKCDFTLCVNDEHLFPGSLSDNTQDMLKKGRHRNQWN